MFFIMQTKECRLCFSVFSIDNFYVNRMKKDGLFNECKTCIKQRTRKYEIENKEKVALKRREYRDKNRDYFNLKNKKWRLKTNYGSNYTKRRLKEDHFFKFINRLRTLIRNSITKQNYTKKSKSFQILGCDNKTLINHFESKFKDGMSWDNYGEWHIDHIIPISKAKTEDEAIKLNHYTNLQPLWAKDNLKKSNKII